MPVLDLTLEALQVLTGGRLGTVDGPCPACGPDRENAKSRKRAVFRIWAMELDFASFLCVRCGLSGWARAQSAAPINRKRVEAFKIQAARREAKYQQRQIDKATWIYRRAGALQLVPRYLAGRGITCALPRTLRELAPRGGHNLAMVMPFGMPDEPEPGLLGAVASPCGSYGDRGVARGSFGIHLTLLTPDGSAKAGTGRDKLMLGPSAGLPIVIAPPNDGLGLVISEGIEDALSAHQATGLGAWAAGAASRLPALAERVPDYIESVTVLVDDDDAGRTHASELVNRLTARGIETRAIELGHIR